MTQENSRMTGAEAIQALKEGKKVKLKQWDSKCFIQAYHTRECGWEFDPSCEFYAMFYPDMPEKSYEFYNMYYSDTPAYRCTLDNLITNVSRLFMFDDWEIVE